MEWNHLDLDGMESSGALIGDGYEKASKEATIATIEVLPAGDHFGTGIVAADFGRQDTSLRNVSTRVNQKTYANLAGTHIPVDAAHQSVTEHVHSHTTFYRNVHSHTTFNIGDSNVFLQVHLKGDSMNLGVPTGISTVGWTESSLAAQMRIPVTCHKGRQLQDAMLSTGFSPTLLTYNALIQGLCKNKEERLAKELYKEMISKGISPDDNTIYSLIEGIPNVDEFLANDR
ncbi:pentatricopeptide repeat (PPR) superfamily protein [Artemisia annua]|uniref:Pentatricopeptide repeat (PPR) superfamily protein n=1 Tax=Artemisia annua TaxID=35608 RepID=A0A2U1NLU2_ARTAN|nr:pentatricopeptide repeat (PPR) superfamily protein [Artemisia annua]